MKDEDIEKKQKENNDRANKILELENNLKELGFVFVSEHKRHTGKIGNRITVINSYIKRGGKLTEKDYELHEKYISKYINYFKIKRCEFYDSHTVDTQFCTIGNRICDVLITIENNEKVCCEIQLSPVSFKELESRTNEYISNGYKVEWILPICGDAYKQRVFWRLLKKFKSNNNLHSSYNYIKETGFMCRSFTFMTSDSWYLK